MSLKRTILAAATSLALLTSVSAMMTTASAHNCQTVGQTQDAVGCNAHNCGNGVHDHEHDVPYYDPTQNDHACVTGPGTPSNLGAGLVAIKNAA